MAVACVAIAVVLLASAGAFGEEHHAKHKDHRFSIPLDHWYYLFECRRDCSGMCMSDNNIADNIADQQQDTYEHEFGEGSQQFVGVQTPVAYYCFPIPWYLCTLIICAVIVGFIAICVMMYHFLDLYWPYDEIRMPAYVLEKN